MPEIISVIAQLSVLTFVLSSMLAMGLSLTIQQIWDPLRNVRLVILALLANFILVPALAYLIQLVLPLDDGLSTGLILVGCAAGAPFLTKLVQVAKGDAAFSVGLMTLLMVVTVFYLPTVLPVLLPGASVSPWDIARSLIMTMLVPLGIGLFFRARYASAAASLAPHLNQISSMALVLIVVAVLVLEFSAIIGIIGTGGILAALIFLVGALAIGLLLGGIDPSTRPVLGLGTAQRNLAAAMLVAGQSFSDEPNVLVMVMLVLILGIILLMVVGGEMGKRVQAQGEAQPSP
jgi:BASS family bile acid:Na+ symporter